tara:strand:- start:230 stop:454 length:225 start_codon:yes stop_codon:yes gene_type:complete
MEDKNVEMIGKLLEVCKKLKETIESQASVIFKLHAQMQSQDERIKSLELTLEDNPDKYQSVSKDNEDYFVQPND